MSISQQFFEKEVKVKIYLSSMTLAVLLEFYKRYKKKKLNALISFGTWCSEYKEIIYDHRSKLNSLILDSGTWTRNNPRRDADKRKITLNRYINYSKLFGSNFDFYFNFDSDFSVNGFTTNYSNQLKMQRHGLNPIPVIHDYYGSEIEFFIKKKPPLVALGSYGGRNLQAILYAANKLKANGMKVHLFRGSSYNTLSRVPLATCDSSSWTQYPMYGYVPFWNDLKPTEDKTDFISFEDYIGQKRSGRVYFNEYKFIDEFENYISKNLNLAIDNLTGGKNFRIYRQLVSILYYMKLEDILKQK